MVEPSSLVLVILSTEVSVAELDNMFQLEDIVHIVRMKG